MRAGSVVVAVAVGLGAVGCSGGSGSEAVPPTPSRSAQPVGFDVTRDCRGDLVNVAGPPYYSRLPTSEAEILDWELGQLEKKFGPLTTTRSKQVGADVTFRLADAQSRPVGELVVRKRSDRQYELLGGTWCNELR